MINVFDKSDYSIRTPIRNIGTFFRHIKWARQRAKRGFADRDAWDVDGYLDDLIPGILEKFLKDIEVDHGIPWPVIKEYYEKHKDETGCEWEEFQHEPWTEPMEKECKERWKNVIKEMIFLFREQNYDTCSMKNTVSWEDDSEREEWRKREAEIEQYRNECRAKAFALLAEWYECLWT